MSTKPSTAPQAGPVTESERLVVVDGVRGLAVLGILVMNIVEFALPRIAYDNPGYAGGAEGLDLWTWYMQGLFFDGRMRALFSMLFGAGIVMYWQRCTAKGLGDRGVDLLLRRCLWLVAFGLVHRFGLLWTGDILYMYGLLGLIALPFRLLRAHTLAVCGLLVLAMMIPRGIMSYGRQVEVRAQWQEAVAAEQAGEQLDAELTAAKKRWESSKAAIPPAAEKVDEEVRAMRGSYPGIFAHLWPYNHTFQSQYLYHFFVWDILGMVFLGMALMKTGFLAGRCRAGVYGCAIACGALICIVEAWRVKTWAASGFSLAEPELRLWRDLSYPFTRLLGALGWAGAMVLMFQAGILRFVFSAFAAVGRMAFTNYILQTVLCTLIFYGYGLGWYGSLCRWQLMIVVLVLSLVQLAFSVLWLRFYRFGPIEWCWRSLTWWHRQPMRR